jgi:hypothetical protein
MDRSKMTEVSAKKKILEKKKKRRQTRGGEILFSEK